MCSVFPSYTSIPSSLRVGFGAYTPNRFIQAAGDGTAPDVLAVCIRLINKGETLEYLDSALRRFPTLLTLEDFVSRCGSEWGFDAVAELRRCSGTQFDPKVAMAFLDWLQIHSGPHEQQ